MVSKSISLEEVLANNANLKKGPKGLVGVFVGGTSGLAEWTFRAFIKHTNAPRAYIIGRNQEAADRIISDAASSNPEAHVTFLSADCTLLKEVSRVCSEIKQNEEEFSGPGKSAVNLLVLTPSFSSLAGRSETPEGLDKKFTLIYHARLLFTHRLQPLLTVAAQQKQPSRVLSILTPGSETPLSLPDLDLNSRKYSVSTCLAYATTMTTLSFRELAKQNPGTSYLQTNPGIVKTGVARYLPWYGRAVSSVGYALLSPWRMDVEEAGERQLEMALAGRYAAVSEGWKGEVAEGVGGQRGVYVLWKTGEGTGKREVIGKMVEEGYGEKVLEHTLEIFEAVEKIGRVQ